MGAEAVADDAAAVDVAGGEPGRSSFYLEILLVSFAALLLEISYTRIISFKLFYYYTYLVIGLALMGLGVGGVIVAISGRVRRASTEAIVMSGALLGAAGVGIGYVVVAYVRLDTFAIWEYGSWSSLTNVARLLLICIALFAAFVAVGVVISTLFARRPERIGRLYFADLLGAGLACAIVVSLLGWIGPPATIFLAGALLGFVGLRVAWRARARAAAETATGSRSRSVMVVVSAVLTAVLLLAAVRPALLPEQRLETTKLDVNSSNTRYSSWSALFRVDVQDGYGVRNLVHDGLLGSVIDPYNGKVSSLGRFRTDPRALPFAALASPPGKELIIGAAGGHEILASLFFRSHHIDAVELNPVTYKLLTDTMADYAGHITDNPKVNYVNDEGRSYLARQDGKYNLIWYPAPDSYSATNAASAGAFVLSESYLYTKEAIDSSLDHVTPHGIVAAQFGEYDYAHRPNRTTRYVSTARAALADRGIHDPARHILVVNSTEVVAGTLSTIIVRKAPFTKAEVEHFATAVAAVPGSTVAAAPGTAGDNSPAERLLATPDDKLDAWYSAYPYDVRPVTDNKPFFWHFTPFGDVMSRFADPIERKNWEVAGGERVLVLLLLIAIALATIFLLLPFVAIRDVWRRLPRKANSALYFAALGLGFIFFEITLIQRLTLFLGFPTYSLTITLMSILIFTGIGALLSSRYQDRRARVAPILLAVLAALTLVYLFVLPEVTDSLLAAPLAVRALAAFVLLAPLGICLGAFMPLGIGAVAELGHSSREYIAWSWAVNGFASVVGSVLSTILAMTFGFRAVLVLALGIYVIAVVALRLLSRPLALAAP